MPDTGRRQSPSVVVVEDHEDSRVALVRLLGAVGYAAVGAGSVREAEELVERHGCDLLIADIGLPDGSGLDLLRKLRAKREVGAAIALTGFAEHENEAACRSAGFTEFIPKPVRFEELEAAVKRLLPQ
jgi:DNA-binding response OmpR family regulator